MTDDVPWSRKLRREALRDYVISRIYPKWTRWTVVSVADDWAYTMTSVRFHRRGAAEEWASVFMDYLRTVSKAADSVRATVQRIEV